MGTWWKNIKVISPICNNSLSVLLYSLDVIKPESSTSVSSASRTSKKSTKEASMLVTGFAMRNFDSFQTALIEEQAKARKAMEESMLVTGFGMRNVESLQRALLEDEQRRLLLLQKYGKDNEKDQFECLSISDLSSKTTTKSSVSEIGSQADASKSFSLQYLMGLGMAAEEEDAVDKGVKFSPEIPPLEGEADDITGTTIAMRKAQKFLRSHKIFEFFQFLIAHLLSALPEDPIQFLLDLLDKCLIYRSGLGNPPLLYEKAHLGSSGHLVIKA